MPHSFGYRARTRDMFARPFRKRGVIPISTYFTEYNQGDFVDVVGNGAIHKGMPHKYYHGKTGIVWNVTKRAIGVEMKKQVGHRYMTKRIHVRVEHVKQSRCRVDFLARVKRNEALKAESRKTGKKVQMKRLPAQPKPGKAVRRHVDVETIAPAAYEFLV